MRDITPPIAVCEKFRVVTLGGDCRARIYAEAFDDGSYDNCEIVRMEVARKRGVPNSPCAPGAIDSTQIFGGGFGPFVEFCCADLTNSGNRHIVFFRVVDAAGNSNVCMVEVEVQDKLPPTMVAPPDITVDCRYHFDFTDSTSRASQFGTVVIGNQTRRLLPSPNPFVAARQADRCNRVQNYPGNNPGAPAVFLDGAAFDNCFPIVPMSENPQMTCALRITETVVGDLVCRTSVNGPILRVFTVTDNYGNIARCTQQITVTNLYPFNSGENLPGIVYQGDGPDRGFYLVYRQIQGVSGTYESNYVDNYTFPVRGPFEGPLPTVPQFLLSCDPPGGITPLGSNGPGIDGKRRFRLRPINPAYPNCNRIDVVWPADLEVDVCGSALTPDSLAANPRLVVGARPYIYREDLCSQVGMTYDEWEFDFDAGCKKIIRRWKLIDWCQEFSVLNPWMWDQIIKVIDNEKPVITSNPGTQCFEGSCNPQTQTFPLRATATDNCADCDEIRWEWEVFPFGNRTSPIRRIDLPGESPNNQPRGCEITVDRVWPATPDNGPAHIIKWIAEDGCGNKAILEVEFRIRDCKKPTPVCYFGLSTDLMPATSEVPIQAVLWDAGSYDNCTLEENLRFRAIRSADNPNGDVPGAGNTTLVFTCADLGTVSIQLWVGDENGNWDYCETFINVQNNMGAICPDEDVADIAGALLSETTSVGVEFVTVKVTTASNIYVGNTDVQGNYTVTVPTDRTYVIEPSRNDNALNGVTTADISLIQRHILGNGALANEYKLIAADATGDGRISAADLVDIRKVILDKAPMFGVNKSWRFVPTEFEFENPTNPFTPAFPESREINPLETDMMSESFTSIKVGDVNGSAAYNSSSFNGGTNRSGVSFDFVVDEISMKKGNEYKVDFRAADIADIAGYQYTMNFNVDMLDFVGFEAGKLNVTEEHFGFSRLDIGRITSSWNTTAPLDLNSDDVLFTLTFRAKSNATLSEAISINSSRIAAEAYTTEINAINLGLVFNTGNGTITAATYELFQNEPNPFANETKISFSLPEAMNASIRVFDVTGKVVRLIEGDFAKGLNNVIVKKSDLPNAGVLYYQLEAGDFKATKKMVIID
ncbi:MAG: T9SS type A sorting domain-containing protein [Saprospiraceae bacterium]|nr:T9SS type A sorting domain-containing protein [Saprospiraceae bacterium]